MAKLNLKTYPIWCFVCFCVVEQVSYTLETPVRLRDGTQANEGRVEVYINGAWISLCHSLMSGYVEETICGQLGFSQDGAQMYYGNSYGPAPGEIYRGRVDCSSRYSNLSNCTFGPETKSCEPKDAMGVSCNISSSEVPNVRLTGGNSSFEGLVEVFRNGVWGTVTESRPPFSILVATVICRMLHGKKYGGSAIPNQQSAVLFGIVKNKAIVMDSVLCNGNETNILDCTYWTGSYWVSHEDDLAIVCKEVPQVCNGYATSAKGRIIFPGYPTNNTEYSDDLDCVWKVDTNLRYSRIQMSFYDVPLANNNTLRVFGTNYGEIAISSTGNIRIDYQEIYIWLQVRAGTREITFSAAWDIDCYFTYTFRVGYTYSISSPGYEGPFPENLKCVYVISYSMGFTTGISFESFGLSSAQDGSCTDYVKIFGGGSDKSPAIGGPYCGSELPAPIDLTNSTFTAVTIVFKSGEKLNTSADEIGFHMYFSIFEPADLILGPYNASSGTLSTPGYPNVYNGEQDIEWVITTKPYTTITLFFQDLQVDSRFYVSDYGLVTRGGQVSLLIQDTNTVYLRLFSSYNNRINKMLLNWTSECRQVIKQPQGILSSPDDSDFDSSSAHCVYEIVRAEGYYISLLFSHVDLARDTNCSNHIKVFDGTGNNSTMISLLCADSQPFRPINSSGNYMTIEFKTDALKGTNNSFSASFSSHRMACPAPTYGVNCTQTCNCREGVERCDSEIGCVCRGGWQGTDCDTDIDECLNQDVIDNCALTNAMCVNSPGTYTCECVSGFSRDLSRLCQDVNECLSSPCSQGCVNTDGSYICTCNNGFILAENGTCEAFIVVGLTITINVVVNHSDLVMEYQTWNQSVTNSLMQYFSKAVIGFLSLVVTNLRAGSIITDVDIAIKSSSAGSLTLAIVNLANTQLTVNNQAGDVQVDIRQKNIQSKCEIFELISPCEEGTECDSTAEVPVCRTVEKSRSRVVVVALAVCIPSGVTVVLILLWCLIRRKGKTSKPADNLKVMLTTQSMAPASISKIPSHCRSSQEH